MTDHRIPIACTLTTKQAAAQVGEWGDLRRAATQVVAVDGGFELTFPPAVETTVRDLAAREAQCCSFLTLTVERTDGDVVLTITGPADAAPVIGLIVGA